MRIALIVLTLILPAAAWSKECPTDKNLSTGIRLSQGKTGETELFRKLPNGLIEVTFTSEAHQGRFLLAHGIYIVKYHDQKDGLPIPRSEVIYEYPLQYNETPLPKPGKVWKTELLVKRVGDLSRERHHYRFGDLETISFGPCDYEFIPVELVEASDNKTRDLLHYIPSLGISYVAGYEDESGKDTYSYDKIEALK
jgi:hypothetical protein